MKAGKEKVRDGKKKEGERRGKKRERKQQIRMKIVDKDENSR